MSGRWYKVVREYAVRQNVYVRAGSEANARLLAEDARWEAEDEPEIVRHYESSAAMPLEAEPEIVRQERFERRD